MRRLVRAIARRLPLAGNLAFLVGSVLFLSEAAQTVAVWLFILGSATFLLDGLRGGEDRP